MIIDSHVHILPDRIRTQVDKAHDPWFAACHSSGQPMASAQALVTAMDAQGIDRAVCLGWPFADPRVCAESNDYIAAAVRQYPERLLGFGIVNPHSADAAQELTRCARMGLMGVGEINADAQGWTLDHAAFAAFAARAIELDLVVNLHVSEPLGRSYPGRGTFWPQSLLTWHHRFPELRTVAAHLGGGLPLYAGVSIEAKAAARHFWFDTAAAPFLYAPSIYAAVLGSCADQRLLLGTDFPLLKLPRYLAEFSRAGLNRAQISAITGENAARLFGI